MLLAVLAFAAAPTSAADWMPVRWHGESAYVLETAAWRAIVSVERGRLVHFGPAASEVNFVFAPAGRDARTGWGGHRVWLGPQDTWSSFWPPPAEWEQRGAETVTSDGAELRLMMPATGDGWPQITRVYALDGNGQLACRIELGADGTRAVQIMQILQTPPSHNLTVPIIASADAPLGCLLLPPFRGRRGIVPLLEPLPYMSRTPEGLLIRQAEQLDKIAFPPQSLEADYPPYRLRVARGPSRGAEVGAPDRGFYTQICPGDANNAVIELEQMSPLYRAGEAAAFTMILGLDGE